MESPPFVLNFLKSFWWLTAEMAPYLLLGFLVAGLLRVFFTEDWVRRHLGQRGLRQIFKAVIIGIPLPLCSCGVIPVAAGIRRQGGQRGAVAAFTASTPQTGVDSIAATVGMLGWVFAIVRIVIAFINGIVAGLVVEKWGDGETSSGTSADKKPCCAQEEKSQSRSSSAATCCSPKEGEAETRKPDRHTLKSGLSFGLVTLPRDLFGALVVGLLLAGLIGALAPADLFEGLPGGHFTLYGAMTLVSLPLYVCSTGSIPMAVAFLHAGMSPGAVLLFLIAGPATNTATVTSLWSIIGGKATIGYILSIILTGWIFAILVDFSGISLLVAEAVHEHDMGINLFQHIMGGILVVLLLTAKFMPRK